MHINHLFTGISIDHTLVTNIVVVIFIGFLSSQGERQKHTMKNLRDFIFCIPRKTRSLRQSVVLAGIGMGPKMGQGPKLNRAPPTEKLDTKTDKKQL